MDSVPLALEISRRAEAGGFVQDILAEINIGRESGKGGFLPENLENSLDMMSEFHGIRPVSYTHLPATECLKNTVFGFSAQILTL